LAHVGSGETKKNALSRERFLTATFSICRSKKTAPTDAFHLFTDMSLVIKWCYAWSGKARFACQGKPWHSKSNRRRSANHCRQHNRSLCV